MTRMLVAKHLHAISDRVLVGGTRYIVKQGLHHESRMGGANAAPPQNRHVGIRMMHCQAHRKRIGLRIPSVVAASMPSFTWNFSNTVPVSMDWPTMNVIPGQHIALFVKADAGAVKMHWTVVAAPHIVLAAPERAHRRVQPRRLGGFGYLAGLHCRVAAAGKAPAEAAARCLHVHHDLFRLEAEHVCGNAGIEPGTLAPHPDLGTIVGKPNRTVQRFHRRVGEIREHELGFQFRGAVSNGAMSASKLARAGASGQSRDTGQVAFHYRPFRQPMCPTPP